MTVYSLFGQAATGSVITIDATAYTMGMQFSLSQAATLTGIWFYSAPGATGLPVGCAVYRMTGTGTGTIVTGSQNSSPSWSGAAASGWVKCAYAGGPGLSSGTTYKAVILKDTTQAVYSFTSHYWDTGAGGSGLSAGIISAPAASGADGGQDTFTPSPTFAYPASSFNATNYWIDVEVTTASFTAPPLRPAGQAVNRASTY